MNKINHISKLCLQDRDTGTRWWARQGRDDAASTTGKACKFGDCAVKTYMHTMNTCVGWPG